MKISVVIPTTGKRDLNLTLKSLYNSHISIDEIIIVTLDIKKLQKHLFEFQNLKLIKSKKKGQVKQRIEGFKLAKGDYVLQLDDDIILDNKCIKLLYHELKNLPNASISPNVFDIKSKNSIFNKNHRLRQKVFNLISGLKPYNKEGKITISGFESYPKINSNSDVLTETEWLIGGCVLHHRKNLILKNYYPFDGKAYSEDLFHSLELRKNNIKLFIHKEASIFLEQNEIKTDWSTFKKELLDDLRVRKFFVSKYNLSFTRMYLIYFFRYINFFLR